MPWGFRRLRLSLKEEGGDIPDAVKALIESGGESFYRYEEGVLCCFDPRSGSYAGKKPSDDVINISSIKREKKTVIGNSSASLVDIGDEVLCLEFHSPNQSINLEVLDVMEQAVLEMEGTYEGMVIANQANNFCVGADLKMILSLSGASKWEELDQTIKRLQDVKYGYKICIRTNRCSSVRHDAGGRV